VACVLRVSLLPPLCSLSPCSDVTALQANGSTSAASYIAAEKLRINVAGIATPEIEFQFRGDSRVEVYFNRFITKNEFQVRPPSFT
jgi:hypothetical protein